MPIVKSIKIELGRALLEASKVADSITGQSINALPEYFLSVKIAEYLHNKFESYTFSMEDSFKSVATELGINAEGHPEHFRLSGKVDLVLRNQNSKKAKHIVEFKRGIKSTGLKKDALRLAWLCENSPSGHKTEKNYLVVVTHKSKSFFKKRHEEIIEWVAEEFDYVSVNFHPVPLPNLLSTNKYGLGKELFGGVWEFKYDN